MNRVLGSRYSAQPREGVKKWKTFKTFVQGGREEWTRIAVEAHELKVAFCHYNVFTVSDC